MNNPIKDVDLSSGALGELENRIPDYPPGHEVESAVEALVTAAVKAREYERDQAAKGALATNVLPPTYDQDPEGEVESACPDLKARFLYFYERSPIYPATVRGELQAAKTAISSAQLSPMAGLDGVLAHWAGDTKDDFLKFFVNPMISFAIPNQQAALDDMIVAMTAYEGLLRAAHMDAKVLADEAAEVLNSLDDWTSEDTQQVLDMVGIGIDVASSDSGDGTGKATLSTKLGMVGIGISAVEAVADTNIDADGALDVMAQVDTILTGMKTIMDGEEEAMAETMRTSLSEIQTTIAADEPLDSASILPLEPKSDGTPNLTDGKTPHGYPNFYPHG